MLKWHDFGLSSEDTIERKRSQDDDFCRAMRAAIYSGTESCPVGVSTEPGTKNPFSTISGSVITERQSRSVSGTVFADGRPRIVDIKGIRMDAGFGPSMIYITNFDKPGFIGRFSSVLGDGGINIATFHVGRDAPGGNAIALIEIDGELPPQVLAAVRALPQVQQAKTLGSKCERPFTGPTGAQDLRVHAHALLAIRVPLSATMFPRPPARHS